MEKGRCGICKKILPAHQFSKKTKGHKTRFCKKCDREFEEKWTKGMKKKLKEEKLISDEQLENAVDNTNNRF